MADVVRARALAVVLTLLVASAWPLVGSPQAACATEGPRAALVVDDGSVVLELCVALDAATVSGTHLIELAHAQHGLAYSLGFGDQAVCMLNGVGTSGGDCFADYPNFWGYWHGDGRGGWTWGSSGAATFDVENGDIEGWVFGSGDSPTTHAQPPAVANADVCASTEPSPSPPPTSIPGPNGAGDASSESGFDGAGTADTGNEPGDRDSAVGDIGGGARGGSDHTGATPAAAAPRDRPGEREDRSRRPDPAPPVQASSGEADIRAATSRPDDGHGGASPGVFVAIVLGTLLGGAGWWRLRPARARRAA